jgi:hypothetical protein
VKRSVALAFALAALLAVPAPGAALPGPAQLGSAPGDGGLWVPVRGRRCYPSQCNCIGSRATACTRDCRRDRVCACRRGRYICSLYVRR